MDAAVKKQPAGPQSVERIFETLEHIAAKRAGLSLTDLARFADAPKTSMVGLLAGMVKAAYLSRDAQGLYTLGPRMLSLALRMTAQSDLTSLARPVLVNLVQKSGETALLAALSPDADVSMYIDKVETASPVRYTVSLGERRELYCSAIGKVLLAYMDPTRREEYLRTVKMHRFTPNTITSLGKLRAELANILRAGIAHTHSERILGASALAAPVFGSDGQLVVGITLAGPSERIRENRVNLERHLREATHDLSELIAGRSAALAATVSRGPAAGGKKMRTEA